MELANSTRLETVRLRRMFLRHTLPYRHEKLAVRVRYSRGAEFSGTCYYTQGRIFVNLGRSNRYPYTLATGIAKAQSNRTHWWRRTCRLTVADAYELALFVYLHELYHYLIKAAGRSPRGKEGMCDRFAARVLVDCYGCGVCDDSGRPVARRSWDFKDLDAFVAAAPRQQAPPRPPSPAAVPAARYPSGRPIPVVIHGRQRVFDFRAGGR